MRSIAVLQGKMRLTPVLPMLSFRTKSVFSPCYLPSTRAACSSVQLPFLSYSKIVLELVIVQFFTCLISSGVLLF